MSALSPAAALFERALRVVRGLEAENVRLKAECNLQRGDIALLRQRVERLEQELAAERGGRIDLVDHLIDWLEQGEEIVRAGIVKGRHPRPAEPLPPGQTARSGVLADIAEHLGGARERMGTAEFAHTFGGEAKPPSA